MDEQRKALRRRFSGLGWALLIYLVIMNVSVMLVCLLDVAGQMEDPSVSLDDFGRILTDSLTGNGWGYVLAILIGLLILRLWKGRAFCYQELWTPGRRMEAGDFFAILCIFVSGQVAFQIFAVVLEFLLNQLGLSALDAIEMATGASDTFSMFLYMGVLAPVAEELLFRGLALRTLLPYGKRFAVLTSAFLFGIFHGNLVQTPYAFCVGLVLGYTAAEYSIVWAMALHMFNNLILADMMTRLTSSLPGNMGDILSWTVIGAFSVGAVAVLILRRKDIAAYFRGNKVNGRAAACFFSAPGILVLTVFMLLDMAVTLLLQLI